MIINPEDQKNELVFLPTEERTAAGQKYNTADDTWSLAGAGGKTQIIDFASFRHRISDEVIDDWKTSLVHLLKNSSVAHSAMCHVAFGKLLDHIDANYGGVTIITSDMLEDFLDICEKKHEVKGLLYILRVWRSRNLSNVSDDCYEVIDNYKHGETKGAYIDVLSLDPDRGPYIDTENQMIDEALLAKYQSGELKTQDFCITMLFRLYGQRTQQVANLKVRDLRLPKYHDVERATIEFPFAKQKNGVIDLAPLRPIPMALQSALEEQFERAIQDLPRADWGDRPLFPAINHLKARHKPRQDPGFEGHYKSCNMSDVYKKTMNSLSLISPRTGLPMVHTTVRERHTVGTHLAIQGLTAEQIASTLQQTDSNSCEAYVSLGIQHHQLMHSALDGEFTHFAARFFGEIIASERLEGFTDEAIVEFEAASKISDIGGCAAGGCSAMETDAAPFACFTCHKFRLAADAPLDDLLRLVIRRYEAARQNNDRQIMSTVARHINSIAAAKRQILEYKNPAGGCIQ